MITCLFLPSFDNGTDIRSGGIQEGDKASITSHVKASRTVHEIHVHKGTIEAAGDLHSSSAANEGHRLESHLLAIHVYTLWTAVEGKIAHKCTRDPFIRLLHRNTRMTRGKVGHVENQVGQLSGLAHAPIYEGEGAVFGNVIWVQNEVLDADIEDIRRVMVGIFTLDESVTLKALRGLQCRWVQRITH